MLVRTRQEYACTTNCFRQLRRAVWDGDQLLYEIAAPGQSGAAPAVMERDTGLAPNFKLGFYPTGRVEYVHGAELDAPLAVYRAEYSDSISGGYYIPLANWKGSYDSGYSIEYCYTREWSTAVAPPVGPQVGGDTTKSNATSGTEELCPTVEWPAQHEWAARQYRRGYGGPRAWMGSLIYGQRDFSGLHYRRNRFYDSEQGRFTQEDPIGMAGGINLYGFANGDPTSYDDPYGLCPVCVVVWGVIEVAGSVSDAVDVVRTVRAFSRGAATTATVVRSVGGAALGTFAPGAGYGRVANVAAEHGDEVADGARAVINAGTSGGARAGKGFTRAGRREVIEANRRANGGVTRCANSVCGVETVPAQQHTRGVTPPGNETHVDHIKRRREGGDGSPSNGQVLCRSCNLEKGE